MLYLRLHERKEVLHQSLMNAEGPHREGKGPFLLLWIIRDLSIDWELLPIH
jgi:hypothetical protein